MKGIKRYQNISAQECGDIYLGILENANKYYKKSEVLAVSDKEYGLPISFMILGLEEQIKALIIFLDSKGFSFRQTSGLKGIFNNHELRYCVSFIIFAFNLFANDLSKNLNNFLESIKGKKAADYPEFKSNVEKNIGLHAKKSIIYAIEKLKKIFQEIDWFKDAGLLREAGFYVDYCDGLNKPSDFKEEDYLELKKRIEVVDDFCKKIIAELNSEQESTNKILNHLVKGARTENVYKSISAYITRAKKDRKSVLELIIEDFSPIVNVLTPTIESLSLEE